MKRFRTINWPEYNKALIQRGSINLWLSEEVIAAWTWPPHEGRNGRPRKYSDEAIICALTIRAVFNLPLRAVEGFLRSLFQRIGIDLPVPSYSVICRRAEELKGRLPKLSTRRPTDLVLDSSGMKIYGEGEWKVRIHGKGKRRTWRKVHIALDPHSQVVVVSDLTGQNEADAQAGAAMMQSVPKTVQRVFGDGAYDGRPFRRAVHRRGATTIVPPCKGATVSRPASADTKDRDDAVSTIAGLGGGDEGRKAWKELTGYHIRSLVETAFSRIKTIFGHHLSSRTMDRQSVEFHIKCLILNRFTKLGMPKGYWEQVA